MAELNTILSPTLFGKKLVQITTTIVRDISSVSGCKTITGEQDRGTFIGYDGSYYLTLDSDNILTKNFINGYTWKFV